MQDLEFLPSSGNSQVIFMQGAEVVVEREIVRYRISYWLVLVLLVVGFALGWLFQLVASL